MNVRVLLLLALPLIASASDPSPPVGVPKDARFHNGAWFRVYRERGSWQHAQEACKRLGGQLASIPDESTWNFLKPFIGDSSLWLGATDEDEEGVWKWIDGTPFTFSAWFRGEPTGTDKEFYLCTLHGAWNDARRNDDTSGFVCMWKAIRN